MQLDFGITPNIFNKTQIVFGRPGYIATGATINALQNLMYLWRKPIQANFIHILCIGGGGGGGSGRAITAGSVTNGASGGGGGAYTSQIYPAFIFPNEVWLAPADGGAGGATFAQTGGGAAGGNGGISYVLLRNDSLDPSMQVQISGGVGAANDGEAAGGAAGAGITVSDVAGGAVVTTAGMLWGFTNGLVKTAVIGNAGGAGKGSNASGSTGKNSTAMSALTDYICTGGAGGGGSSTGNTPAAGGSVTFTSTIPYNGSVPGGATTAPGCNGISTWVPAGSGYIMPFFSTGGGGGGGAAGSSSVAGIGGAGGVGSGGGGGGGANGTGCTSGAGGAGGPGAIVITYW